MADQSDIEQALAAQISATLYPQGIDAPSVAGPLCRIFRGWPQPAALEADLALGHVTVTIFPDATGNAITTRFINPQAITAPSIPTLAVTSAAQSVSFTGTAAVGQIAGILVDNAAFVHRVAPGDDPSRIAAILAAFIAPYRMAIANGSVLTIPGAGSVIARVVADQSFTTETRRQRAGFRVSCWCSSPALRDQVASLIDASLSIITFLSLADGSSARLTQTGSVTFDQSQNANLYRRDLNYAVEFATTITEALPSLIFGNGRITPGNTGPTRSVLG